MVSLSRRALMRATAGCMFVVLGTAPALGMRRSVDDLGIDIELPDHWVPIPRAEILEARERALAAGAAADWTTRAAWQPPPHLRWFTIPHLTLDSRPAVGQLDAAVAIAHLTGRAGARTVHTHQASWRRAGLDLRLVLLSFDDRRDDFDGWLASMGGVQGDCR